MNLASLTIEERIRLRAYELWLQDGGLEGCADEYWRQARATVEDEVAKENVSDIRGR